MALPSSGPISMSQINTELGRSATSAISLDTAENGGYGAIKTCFDPYPSGSNPASMSEWRGYNHSIACTVNCGTSESNLPMPYFCSFQNGIFNVKEVLLGGYTSGTVNVFYNARPDSSQYYMGLYIYIVYNGVTVASHDSLPVITYPNAIAGTLTFTATGAADRYYVYFTEYHCP